MEDGRWNWACASTRLSDYNAASISRLPSDLLCFYVVCNFFVAYLFILCCLETCS